jgi:hypothetical protein
LVCFVPQVYDRLTSTWQKKLIEKCSCAFSCRFNYRDHMHGMLVCTRWSNIYIQMSDNRHTWYRIYFIVFGFLASIVYQPNRKRCTACTWGLSYTSYVCLTLYLNALWHMYTNRTTRLHQLTFCSTKILNWHYHLQTLSACNITPFYKKLVTLNNATKQKQQLNMCMYMQ